MKLVSIPANPAPDDYIAGMLKTPDGVALRYARWLPPAGRRGTVCVFPGRSEWIEKYFETVRDLRARGFAVAALDWRGQGLSDRALGDRRKGYVRNFAEYDVDLDTFMREIVLPDCPPPIFGLGHSTGAAVLIRAAYRGHRWFDRLVLTAPLLGLGGVDYSHGFGPLIVRALRLAGFGTMYVPKTDTSLLESRPFLGNILTSDPVRFARNAAIVEAEPALGVGAPTVAWMDAAFRAMRAMRERSFAARLRQPMLIVAGGNDAIISNAAIEHFASMLRAGSHLLIVGAAHEILMEQDRYRSQFWAAFDAFVPGTPLY
ncbi:MAG TPA: alpha/beta hydrolase [Xanthobacteraceae bacterium]|jgi:lysophospholipase|nr:alpha/beta hydrolase [Xanthobacteraceae bacterium]